ncbi:N-acetyltransferase [Vibrio sp. LaRot3]|uniref:N-acetyltransferase n=1 Tax=Vibrio sp. LaRot3 TaxID=2998829 RepID=UPI0022CE30D2|nr:N-acetyltransferase [Vibrio sp. LaRot3]MDA0148395.1 N-acetyltransferase [Vibrio sp. LaRot3]
MIRQYTPADIDQILDIWLEASIKAHDFVAPEFWQSQVANMREIYIPASNTYVFEKDSNVIGFYSLYENQLAAMFVSPLYQGQGMGKELMAHAKGQCAELTLNVYKDNQAAYKFYLSRGFTIDNQHVCEHTGCAAYSMFIRRNR